MKQLIKNARKEWAKFQLLLKDIPATCMVFFVVSVVAMNILANKELINTKYLCLDCGFAVSWISFLSMDMIIRRFGPKASIQLSLFAEFVNLIFCGLFFLLCLIPGNWGESYTYNQTNINAALDATIGGTWYVVVGSTIAFIVSSIVNAFVNHNVGRLIRSRDTFKNYAIRSYVSTFIGQFVDNLIFAYIVSINFFGWTHIQCWVCALTGATFELLCEVIFSPLGYKVYKGWAKNRIGEAYLQRF